MTSKDQYLTALDVFRRWDSTRSMEEFTHELIHSMEDRIVIWDNIFQNAVNNGENELGVMIAQHFPDAMGYLSSLGCDHPEKADSFLDVMEKKGVGILEYRNPSVDLGSRGYKQGLRVLSLTKPSKLTVFANVTEDASRLDELMTTIGGMRTDLLKEVMWYSGSLLDIEYLAKIMQHLPNLEVVEVSSIYLLYEGGTSKETLAILMNAYTPLVLSGRKMRMKIVDIGCIDNLRCIIPHIASIQEKSQLYPLGNSFFFNNPSALGIKIRNYEETQQYPLYIIDIDVSKDRNGETVFTGVFMSSNGHVAVRLEDALKYLGE